MREEKILNNIGLIYKVLKDINYQYRGKEDLDEIYCYGVIGLIKGIDTQDKEKGGSRYLYLCIKNEIVRVFQRRTTQKRNGEELYLNTSLENTDITFEDILASDINVEKQVILEDEIKRMLEALERYKNPKHREIIKETYGIGCERKTLREISKKYGISHQAIWEMRKRALKWLKKELEK